MTIRLPHLVTSGHRRGGDIFATDLVVALADDGLEQRVGVLRTPDGPSVPVEVPVQLPTREDRPEERRSLPPIEGVYQGLIA